MEADLASIFGPPAKNEPMALANADVPKPVEEESNYKGKRRNVPGPSRPRG